jgi:hypothetical protein
VSGRQVVDELSRLAGGAEPPGLDDTGARKMIERAMLSRPAAEPARRPYGMFAVAALACAAIVLWLVPRASHVEPQLLRVTLPTGDRLVGLAGARFDVEKLDRVDRRLRLRDGTVLVDVAHVARGQQFAVTTDHLVAIAKGTVFSVETDPIGSRVRVYEGIVEVTQAGERHTLAAGGTWDSRAQLASVTTERPAVLASAVDEAIRQRTAERLVTRAPETSPTVAVVVADIPSPKPQIVAKPAIEPALEKVEAKGSGGKEGIENIESRDQLYVRASAALAAGKFDAALEIVQHVKTGDGMIGEWWVLEGDALRGLGRPREAADAFDAAAKDYLGPDKIEAAYSAAYLRFHDAHDAGAALASLVASVDAEGSPLEERGLGLRAQILEALGRHDEAKTIAQRYLARFPHGELRAVMSAFAKPK